jgi:protein O-mannosyl-transferase
MVAVARKKAAGSGRNWQWPLALVALTAAVYANTLGLDFAADASYLARDARVQALTAENVGRILREPYWPPEFHLGLFRPVTTLSFLLNGALGGSASAAGWHLLNVWLHLLNVWLVYALARRALASQRVAWLAAAVWAVHPVGVESVANVAGRADLLAATAILGGLLWYAGRAGSESADPLRTAAGVFGIAAAGMFAKESAAVLPALMLLWDMTFGPGTREWKRRIPSYAAAWLAGTLFFALRPDMPPMMVPAIDNPEISAGFLVSRLTALRVIGDYLLLLVWPLHLSSDYGYSQVRLARVDDPASWIAPLVLAALLAVVAMRRRRHPVLFFAAGWFGLALLPVSNLVVIIGASKAERFLYVPAIGFGIAAAALIGRLAERKARYGREITAAAMAVLAVLALRTVARNQDWKDDPTLWSSNLAAAPNSHKVHKNIASALNFRDPYGTLDETIHHLEIARNLTSDLPVADWPESVLIDLGVAYRLKGERSGGPAANAGREWYAKATASLEKAREIEGMRHARGGATADYPQLYLNLGIIQQQTGKPDAALESYRRGLRIDPGKGFFYDAMGRIYSQQENLEASTRIMLEQYLAGASDSETPKRLRTLFGLLPDGGCAFTAAGLDPRCPRVRTEACAAGGNVVESFVAAGKRDEAKRVREVLLGTYACPAGPLDGVFRK